MSIETERIERALAAQMPGARLIRAWPLKGGISAKMVAFEIDGGKKLIARQPSDYKYRRNQNVAQHEFRLLGMLRECGLPVQQGHFVELGEVQPFFVIEFVEGRPEIDPRKPSDFLEKLARQLVAIHRTDLTSFDTTLFEQQTVGYGTPSERLNERLRESEIRAALASVTPRSKSNHHVLRHGDFWPGNVLWHEGEVAAVIDWEEALIGEPLADLAIARLDILWILGPEAMQIVTDQYQTEMALDTSDLPYWDLCAALRPITNIHEWAPAYAQLGRPDITEETMSRHHRWFVDKALMAFSSVNRSP